MDQWIIVNSFGSEGSIDQWIIGSLLIFWDRRSHGSLDHTLIVGTDIGLGAMDRWIIGS